MFGKTPLTADEIAQLRAQADAELRRRSSVGFHRLSALEPYIEEEVEELGRFGDDARLRGLATVFVLSKLRAVPTGDGEAVIEAEYFADRLAERPEAALDEVGLKDWHDAAFSQGDAEDRFARVSKKATELYQAFAVFAGVGASEDPFQSPWLGGLRPYAEAVIARKRTKSFERTHAEIIYDWFAKRKDLPAKYVPRGSYRAPHALLLRRFKYSLDGEKLSIGSTSVRPNKIRRWKKEKRLQRDAILNEAAVRTAQEQARRAMTHAPPAGYVHSAGLREELMRRKDLADIVREPEARHSAVIDALGETDSPLAAWMCEPEATRSALPPGAIAPKVRLSPRSVDALVTAYEKTRSEPFARVRRSRWIPAREIEEIVTFANERVAKKAKGCGA